MDLNEEKAKELRKLGWPPFPFRAEVDYDWMMFPVEGWVTSASVGTISLGGGSPKFRVIAEVLTDYPVVDEPGGETREIRVPSNYVRPCNALDRFISEVSRPDGNA